MKRTAAGWHTIIALTNVVLRDGWTYPERPQNSADHDYRWRKNVLDVDLQWYDDATREWVAVLQPFAAERDAIAYIAERRAA